MAQVNREQWLMKAVEHIVTIFERGGYAVPVVKASIDFKNTGEKVVIKGNTGLVRHQKLLFTKSS